MSERLMAKLDRLGAEAGIKQMTPEIHRFSMLVRADVVAQWPERPWVLQREWVDLTDEEIDKWTPEIHGVIREVIAQLKERNA
jgi:hypothetical protein